MGVLQNTNGPLVSSRNLLLRRLGPAEQVLLEPHAQWVSLDHGATLFRSHDPLDAFYFPDSVFLSLEQGVGDSRHIEVAIVGREGMLGWPSLLSCDHSTHAAVVRSGSGTAVRIGAHALREACGKSPVLATLLLQFVHFVIVQMAHSIISHLHHPLDQRLARWLLMRHDRLRGDVLHVHHEEIAAGLNVRRASVTDHLHVLEGEHPDQHGHERCSGKITIRDRAGLEEFAGETYGAPEAHYRTLIAPFGKSGAGA